MSSLPRIRLCHFSPWAIRLERVSAFLSQLPSLDLSSRVAEPGNPALLRQARLDCDWHGECARCFAETTHPEVAFLPALIVGPSHLMEFIEAAGKRPPDEEWWLVFMGQHPEKLAAAAGNACAYLKKIGVRLLFYAFDEASRTMPCFPAIAPHLDVLIHDEAPLAHANLLRPDCVKIHRSWVANLVPFSVPFNGTPERKILFLGSQMGLTPHRRRQIDFLKSVFKDRFIASHDHSIGVDERASLNRYQVGFCPEGRKFVTPAMSRTHTDRPFWSGCMGLVPVSENSRQGGRLDALASANLVVRYPHADLDALRDACEHALSLSTGDRRRIYDHFNRHETVGDIVAAAIALQSAKGRMVAALTPA